jgi:signal transduction histidine kinase
MSRSRAQGWLHRLPVRARLVVGFVLAMVVVLTGAGAFVFWRVQFALDKRLNEDLAAQTSAARTAAGTSSPADALAALGAQTRDAQLIAADGRVLASGPGLRGRGALLDSVEVRAATKGAIGAGRGGLFSPPGRHIRIRAVPIQPATPGRAVAAVSFVRLDQRDEALRELLVQLALANLLALALASGVGYRLARGALDPVERYRAQAEMIADGATGVRIDVPDGPRDEISRLGTTLNAMLAAQERAAERQQQFVDDASHELRTPISALSAEVELALGRDRPADELRDALRLIASDTARLAALADELLTLGSLGSTTLNPKPILVAGALERAAVRARAQIATDPARTVLIDAPDALRAWGAPGLVDRALGNLVDNAARHGRGTITLSARPVHDDAVQGCILRVHDRGTGMRADFLPHAAERFRRDESARTSPGTGLGLSLVDAIAAVHRGQLRVCSGGAHHQGYAGDSLLADVPCNHPEDGTTVSMLLPGRSHAR